MNVAIYFLMTLFKLKASVTDPSGKVRWGVIFEDWTYIHPLMTVLIFDGTLTFLL